MAKMLLILTIEQLQLGTIHPETGMNFHIIDTGSGFIASLDDGTALPCYDDPIFYDVNDFIAGTPWPTTQGFADRSILAVYADRSSALLALRAANISPAYIGSAGAMPLIGSTTLTADTVFYRCLSSKMDHRFIGGQLSAGTYLTTKLDRTYANSGFATVGRFALPLPVPASYVAEYELPKGTLVHVGTVAPAFGQAGGGVEVQLPTVLTVQQINTFQVNDY
ncbi:MAG: hypothetical protein NTNFB02_24910 [Nitrospira sp.]